MRYLSKHLPSWTHGTEPHMRIVLKQFIPRTMQSRLKRIATQTLFLSAFVFVGFAVYWFQTEIRGQSLGRTFSEGVMAVLFWPAFVMLMVLSLGALLYGSNAAHELTTSESWPSIQTTTRGVELSLLTRWFGVYHYLRGLLALVLLARIVLIGGMLYDLTAFQGRYLSMLMIGTVPVMPQPVAVILLTMLMSASLSLPIASVGLDAAVGVWIGIRFHHKLSIILIQLLLIVVRIGYVAGLYLLATAVLDYQIKVGDAEIWFTILAYSGLGDWGLSLLHLPSFGQMMVIVPYSLFLGAVMVIIAIAQSVLADWILARAIARFD